MTELLPKPRREDFISRDDSGHLKINVEGYAVALCEYYKRLAEFAISTLETIKEMDIDDASPEARHALSTIKQGEQL